MSIKNLLDPGRWVALFSKNWYNPFASVFFNFYYLPFGQAIKLPIAFFGQPKLLGMKGEVRIEADDIRFGMIRLNATKHTPHPSIRFEWVNDGGTLVFTGPMDMDNGARINLFGGGVIRLGKGIRATACTLACQEKITIGDHVWIGNGSMVYDTDFHFFRDMETGDVTCPFRPVVIEDDVTIFTQCYIAKGVRIPHHCIVSSRTLLLAKPYKCKPYSLIGGNPASVLATNYEHLRLSGEEEREMSESFKGKSL